MNRYAFHSAHNIRAITYEVEKADRLINAVIDQIEGRDEHILSLEFALTDLQYAKARIEDIYRFRFRVDFADREALEQEIAAYPSWEASLKEVRNAVREAIDYLQDDLAEELRAYLTARHFREVTRTAAGIADNLLRAELCVYGVASEMLDEKEAKEEAG